MDAQERERREPAGSMGDAIARRRDVERRLRGFGRAVRGRMALRGAARWLALAVALVVVAVLLDWRLELSSSARSLVMGALSIALLGTLWWWVLRDQLLSWTPLELAAVHDVACGGAGTAAPLVATVLHLEPDRVVSPELVEAAAQRSYDRLCAIDLRSPLSSRPRNRWLLALAAGILVPVLWGLSFPAAARIAASRWLQGRDTPWPRATRIQLLGAVDGRLAVPRGEPVTLRFALSGRRVSELRLRLRDDLGLRQRLTVRSGQTAPDSASTDPASTDPGSSGATTPDEEADFTQLLGAIQAPTTLWVRGGDGRLGPVLLDPVDRPDFAALVLEHQHPWDVAPRQHDFDRDEGSPSLLAQTRCRLVVTASIPVDVLRLDQGSTAAQPNVVAFEQVDERTFVAEWEHSAPWQAGLSLRSRDEGLWSRTRLLSIGHLRDRPPSVALQFSGVRRRVTAVATIPLQVHARDDFGVDQLSLGWRSEAAPAASPSSPESTDAAPSDSGSADATSGSTDVPSPVGSKPIPLNSAASGTTGAEGAAAARPRSVERQEPLDLTLFQLAPGAFIRLQATVSDACHTGPQAAQSTELSFQIVRPEELFREILLRQQQLRARLRAATDLAEQLRDELNTAALPDDLPQLVRRLRVVQRDVASVHRDLAATVVEMELNQLSGPEALELIQQTVLRPLAEVRDGPLAEQLQAWESLDEAARDAAIERQDRVVEELRRVLKNMAQWDSFIDVVNQLDTVIKLQKALRERAEQLKKRELDSIFEP